MKRIGITFGHREWPTDEDNVWRMKQYILAIEEAGGVAEPLFLPPLDEMPQRAEEVADEFDGLMLSGGADLPPSMYGEEDLPNANISLINLDRPEYELALLDEFVKRDKPILGICYGCQLMNVWRGGTLLQDIATQFPEPIEHGTGTHTVTILPKTLLFRIFGEAEFEVVTSHHQAIKTLGEGGVTAAYAPDRLAESIEFNADHWCVGVQWHPERTRESNASRRLFKAFLQAC
jgi:putative glutamine amidotransferase